MLRLFFIIPTLLVLTGIGVLVYLYKDTSITSYLEKSIEGLDISHLETKFESGEVHFSLSGNYFDASGDQKLVELESMASAMDFNALGFGAVIIPNMQIDHLVVQPEFFQQLFDLSSTKKAKETISVDTSEDEGFIPDFDLESFDRREWLERFTGQKELASEKYINSMRNRAKRIKAQWKEINVKEKGEVQILIDQGKNMISDWDKDEDVNKVKQKINSLKKQFESLKGQKFDKDNIARLVANLNKIKNLKKETDSVKAMISDLQKGFKNKLNYVTQVQGKAKSLAAMPKQIQGDLDGFQRDLKGLQGSIKQDQELLKNELHFKNFDTLKITRLLFGKEWSDELKSYLDLWYKIEDYIPSSGNTKTTEEQEPQSDDQDMVVSSVKYERYNALPDWSLKHLSYTGRSETTEGEEISFQGNLHHISSDEKAHGNNPALDLFGRIAGSHGGTFNINASFSSIDSSPEKRFLKLSLKGRQLKNKVMGKGSSQIMIKSALLAANVDLNLSKVPFMHGQISIKLDNAQFETGKNVKPMVKTALLEALNKTFQEALILRFEYQKGWDSPKIKVDEKFDQIFKDIISSLVSSFAKDQQDRLLGDFSNKMKGQSSDMLKNVNLASLLNDGIDFNSLSQDLLGNLNLWNKSKNDQEKQVNQQRNLLNQLLGSLNNESSVLSKQQDDLKNQVKSMIEKKLTDKLFGGSSNKKSDKKDDKKKKQDNPSIQSIENALKGLF